MITMREIDARRAAYENAKGYRRLLAGRATVGLIREKRAIDAERIMESDVLVALTEWQAQGFRADPLPAPFTSWAAYAGDLAGRLENIRKIVNGGTWSFAHFRECILKEIDRP